MGVRTYFCRPRGFWLRRACKDINCLLHQLPLTDTSLRSYPQDELDVLANSVNTRLRIAYPWLALLQVFTLILARSHQP